MSAFLGGNFIPLILMDAKTSTTAQIKEEQLCWGCAGTSEPNALAVHCLTAPGGVQM